MEVLSYGSRQKLLDYLPGIKSSLREWQCVLIRLSEDSDKGLTITNVADLAHSLFKDKEGKIYVCNARELLMLVRWGTENDSCHVVGQVKARIPEDSCTVFAHEATAEGMLQIEMHIKHKAPVRIPSFMDIRKARRENIILVADDDMYMRMLAKKGMEARATVQEVSNGNDVVTAYRHYIPDMVFLDIHMPGRAGTDVLRDLLAVDESAYIIMLSADSSRENVAAAVQQGAKGFLTKPFSKEKLLDHVNKCPTLH